MALNLTEAGMKKFLFLALFCALTANCDESGRTDKISAAGKAEGT